MNKVAAISVCIISLIYFMTVGSLYPEKSKNKKRPLKSINNEYMYSNDPAAALRLAIFDLKKIFKDKYPRADEFFSRLKTFEKKKNLGSNKFFLKLKREALMANPLLDFDQLLFIRRKVRRGKNYYEQLGLPRNHQCHSSLKKIGYDNEIVLLKGLGPEAVAHTFFEPGNKRFIGEIGLHFNGGRFLFTMSDKTNWKIYEMRTDGTGLRQVSKNSSPDIDNFDACYMPDGSIIFGSTACFQTVPCWHGVPKHRVVNLFRMDSDGKNVRQLCFDQDHDLHPTVMGSGQVLYNRWDYTGIRHEYLRILMVMNPDGTGQRAIYGSNSWWPNSLYFTRPIPGHPTKLITILSGYHGTPRMGDLLLLDTDKGSQHANGVVQRIPGRGIEVKPIIKEKLVQTNWPKFLHPYPLNDKYFIVSCRPTVKHDWGIYLVDVFDNFLLIRQKKGYALLEPIPLKKSRKPPVIFSMSDPEKETAVIYVQDVYKGPGLSGVPRGVIKNLRILAYHFSYPGIGGPSKIGMGGPWEVMQILGTIPVNKDGSVVFNVPANTPVAFQPLDEEGKAVQLMRSWFTAMGGSFNSCIGCHEDPSEAPVALPSMATYQKPTDITPWYGPARGFDFEREVQPVLDRNCVSCHGEGKKIDLRAERFHDNYRGPELHPLGKDRLVMSGGPAVTNIIGNRIPYTPSYDALLPYIRRVGIEDGVDLLVPGEYHADTSELIRMLQKGHHGVELDRESRDRIITWIDLNAPCHGTWSEVYDIPNNGMHRRHELRQLFGGPKGNPEIPAEFPARFQAPLKPKKNAGTVGAVKEPGRLKGWLLSFDEARKKQIALGRYERKIDLGSGIFIKMMKIPVGDFLKKVSIRKNFWISSFEISNKQFRMFKPDHNSGYSSKYGQTPDSPGLTFNDPDQPAVHISWNEAVSFCKWLSEKNGLKVDLPSEEEWEYACRAGTGTPLFYGETGDDFSSYANLADEALMFIGETVYKEKMDRQKKGKKKGGDKELEDWWYRSTNKAPRFGGITMEFTQVGWNLGKPFIQGIDDKAAVTTTVGQYQPNAWQLYDMHGNAAEWTGSAQEGGKDKKIIKGGSWIDRPKNASSHSKDYYPAWQKVHNVGFRIACYSE